MSAPNSSSPVNIALQAELEVAGQNLTATLENESGSLNVAGTWENKEHPLSLIEALASLGQDLSVLKAWDIRIDQLALSWSGKQEALILRLHSPEYGRLDFQHGHEGASLNILVNKSFSLRALPVVGSSFPEGSSLGVGGISLSTAKNTLACELNILGTPLTLTAPLSSGPDRLNGLAEATPASAASTPEAASIRWLKVDKTIAVISLRRIGVQFAPGALNLYVDMAVNVAGLGVALEGFRLGVPMNLDPSGISFGLSGLEVALEAGPLAISGGMLQDPERPDRYAGKLAVRLGKFSLLALGMFEQCANFSSAFVYLLVKYPLGGPPAFFIQGLAGAAGFNYRLTLPALEEVHNFPLVKIALDKNLAPSLGETSRQLGKSLAPDKGNNFFSLGLAFSSFGLAESFLLATAVVGPEMEFLLLGLSRLSVPPKSTKPIVHCEIELRAAYNPGAGFFSLEAALGQNSYVLDKNCRLRGGLAACFWSKGPQAGDFVLSLGGYSPGFKKPEHYPAVERLALDWKVCNTVSLSASAYLAVTPRQLMAGGSFNLDFRDGALSAWFRLSLDLYLEWKPLRYDMRAHAAIGVALDVNLLLTSFTISLELSADVHIYGPEFSGEITLHLYFISFTVSFGRGKPDAQPLNWADFRQSFLPAGKDVLKISLAGGLDRKENDLLILKPHSLALDVSLSVPALRAGFGGKPLGAYKRRVLARPMNSILDSSLELAVEREERPGVFVDVSALFAAEPAWDNLPSAIWADADDQEKSLLPSALNGARLCARQTQPGRILPGPGAYYRLRVEDRLELTAVQPHPGKDRANLSAGSDSGFDPFQPVSVRLLDKIGLPLSPGRYRLRAGQKVSGKQGAELWADSFTASQEFHVAGNRFHLPEEEVHSVYPPDGGRGDYRCILPALALRSPSLPWQSKIDGGLAGPHLALLLIPTADCAVRQVPLAELIRPKHDPKGEPKAGGSLRGPKLVLDPAIGETPETLCRVLDLDKAAFARVVPGPEDLPFTAHVRQTRKDGKISGQAAGEGLAFVSACGRPIALEAEYSVCLVSLEGHGEALTALGRYRAAESRGQKAELFPEPGIRLALLKRWSFYNVKAETDFSGLFNGLDAGMLAGRSPTGAWVELSHRRDNGKLERSWYRGPLLSGAESFKPGKNDRSLESAAQLGRLLAMQDADFSARVLEWRAKGVTWAIDRFERAAAGPAGWGGQDEQGAPFDLLAEAVEAHLDAEKAVQEAADGQTPTDQGIDKGRSGFKRTARKVSANRFKAAAAKISFDASAEGGRGIGNGAGQSFLNFFAAEPVEKIAKAAEPEADNGLDSASFIYDGEATGKTGPSFVAAPEPDPLKRWLKERESLDRVPLIYLLPHPDMLKPEQIRFFKVDADWVGALKYGALSVGRTLTVDELHDVKSRQTLCAGFAGERSGMILRSHLVSIWSALELRAYDDRDTALPILRLEKLNDETVICVCDGLIHRLAIALPMEQLFFSLTGKRLRQLADGEFTNKPFAPLVDAHGRVHLAETAKSIQAGDAADLALQMLGGTVMGVIHVQW